LAFSMNSPDCRWDGLAMRTREPGRV
jgi:hypothetical protein